MADSSDATDTRPTVVSLCCGAGGMDLGFVAAGFRVVYACDFNADAVATYRRNLGDHAEVADLTQLPPERIPDADVWVSGPPCQPYSIAGKRQGAADPRDMWPHVLRLLHARRPPFAVFENVRGLLSWNGGEYVRDIEAHLRGMGYAVTRVVLDAADFGVPQRRHRVFFLCRQGGPAPTPPWPTHQDPKRRASRSIFDTVPRRPWVTVRQALGLGQRGGDTLIDRPSFTVTAAEGKGTSPTDVVRRRKAGAILGAVTPEDAVRIIAQRNATATGHGVGAGADEPSVTVGAGNPPRVVMSSKRARSSASLDAPGVTVAADGRESLALLAASEGPAPTLSARSAGGGLRVNGGAGARRAWERLGIDPNGLAQDLDEPSGTLRAGTHGAGGWSPRHRAGYVVDADGPAPTLFMGGNATGATPGGGGAHQWAVEDAAPDPDGMAPIDLDASSTTLQTGARLSRPGHHGAEGPRKLSGVIPEAATALPNGARIRAHCAGHGEGAGLDEPSVTVNADLGLELNAPAQTLDHTGELHRPGRHDVAGQWGKAATRLRRLTKRECAQLQAFPDWFTFQGSQTAAYTQIGNAVPPLLAWYVANAVRAALGLDPVTVPDVTEWYAAVRPDGVASRNGDTP